VGSRRGIHLFSPGFPSRQIGHLAHHSSAGPYHLAPDFHIRYFDISPDGREVVLERVQERSDVVLLDLPQP